MNDTARSNTAGITSTKIPDAASAGLANRGKGRP